MFDNLKETEKRKVEVLLEKLLDGKNMFDSEYWNEPVRRGNWERNNDEFND